MSKHRTEIKLKKISKKGLPPGSPVYVGVERSGQGEIDLTTYDLSASYEHINIGRAQLLNLDKSKFHWINIIGVHDVDLVNFVCRLFNLHALTEEDILNTQLRPKCEIFSFYMHSALKMIKNENPNIIVEEEQVNLILVGNCCITFQEVRCNFFDPIRKRLTNPDARARRKSADYLFFLIHDLIVDNYIEIIDIVEDTNTKLEQDLLQYHDESILNRIQVLKTDLLYLKKIIYPVKESILKIIRTNSTLIDADNYKYFNDIYDHLIYTNESIETQREITVNNRELYISMMNSSMNNVMKVLTIVTSIFIPLTFIVGIYGMNFDNMPELRTKNGYFICLAVMFVIAVVMIFYFKRKKWL